LIQTEKDLATFYRHIHEPLVKAGINGVKVDVQSGVSVACSGISGGPHMAKLYTQAMENLVAEHFALDDTTKDGAVNCINCMCHLTQNLYQYKVTLVARASEDFFLECPETLSVHLINVANNSLFLGKIGLPNWDMFHSKDESAALYEQVYPTENSSEFIRRQNSSELMDRGVTPPKRAPPLPQNPGRWMSSSITQNSWFTE
jgi:hypothetical protein